MSVVTNVIVTAESDEDPAVEQVNAYLAGLGHGQFRRVDEYAGGLKAVEAGIWVTAFNHLSLSDLRDALALASWDSYDCVRVFVKRQEDDGFELFTSWP